MSRPHRVRSGLDGSILHSYSDVMDSVKIQKFRRAQALQRLSDGRDGVEVTIQFQGEVPGVARPDRRLWIEGKIASVVDRVAKHNALIKPDSVSVSGQTVEAVIPVSELETVQKALSEENCRVDITTRRQVVDPL